MVSVKIPKILMVIMGYVRDLQRSQKKGYYRGSEWVLKGFCSFQFLPLSLSSRKWVPASDFKTCALVKQLGPIGGV